MVKVLQLVVTAIASIGTASHAQVFPTKPVRVLTSEPGGGNDFGARLIAQGLSASMGQQFIVENRGGRSGVIAAEIVAKAAPDGIMRQLNQEIARVLHTAAVKEKFLNSGVEVVASWPEAFAAKIRSEMDRLGPVIRQAGIRVD